MSKQHRAPNTPRLVKIRDINVGPEEWRECTILRLYRTEASDESPEIYFNLMNKELSSDGRLRVSYNVQLHEFRKRLESSGAAKELRMPHVASEEYRNAIPLAMINIATLYNVLVQAKSELERKKARFREENAEVIAACLRGEVEPEPQPVRLDLNEVLRW